MSELQVTSLVAPDNIARMIDLAKRTPRNGLFAEVGVYQGGTAFFLNELRLQQGRPPLHLFDTFTGIPERSEIDFHKVGDFNDTSLERVQALVPDAVYHVGFFPDTLPDDLTGFAFVHVDCDQYESVKACCLHFLPRMFPWGIIYFDDYGCLDGATKAVDECLPGRIVHPENRKAFYVVD